jgi:Flp pilus assembly pilin Flp
MTTAIMNRAATVARRFTASRAGSVGIEYAVLAVILATAVVACVAALGAPLSGIYEYIMNAVTGL